MRNIVVALCRSKFPLKLVCLIAFGSDSKACFLLLKLDFNFSISSALPLLDKVIIEHKNLYQLLQMFLHLLHL